ncbi:MAG: hypothetical protein U0L72_04480 [Acutalibacteraceae bacterium]|nr:hypothetical protein [Acutalibacteraceae bacterium]
MDYKNKKLLILGGAFQHCKLVNEAKKHGIYTIVTDNLEPEDSPSKRIADEYWMLNIYDVDGIVKRCKEEKVDGVLSGWLDPCQRPYTQICDQLGLHKYCDFGQVMNMTDKIAFKAMCKEYGVDIIPDYNLKDVSNKSVEFPVFVKPVDSRGSRGQTVCNTYEELDKAITFAQRESSDGGVLIEKYMEKVNEFHVTYFFVNGEPYLVRGSDNYCGPKETGMDKVVSCAVYPSRFLSKYIDGPHKNVVNMFKNLGIKNGPIFMQGFRDGDKFRFFDPGLRFPGVDCELVIKEASGVNYMKAMIDIALSGKCDLPNANKAYKLNDKIASVLYLNVRPGKIVSIKNEEAIKNNPAVIAYLPRCKVGDKIEWVYNVNQRFAEIDILTDTFDELIEVMDAIQKNIFVEDENGENMIFNLFDLNRIER